MRGRTHTRRNSIPAAATLALALTGAACGGSGASAPPNCLQALPCGGDVVGTWSFLGGCLDAAAQTAQLEEFCPGSRVNGYGLAISGTLTFSANFTYSTSTWTQTFASSLTTMASCLGFPTCADASQAIDESSPVMTRQQVTTCTGTTTCSCYTSGTATLSPDAGTWRTAGTTLDMLGASSMITDYCVEGDRLHLLTVDASGALLADLVAERR
jgi:hypothetical protein